ncbi:tetratricopeptide repeat protein [Kitasatospora sp. NPDC057692]|uniref:tetratricopeptide repeat protein n=1 Tax=Kitasatospora sp. NPDC057692 TaxID=3346215 RepID=UPI00369C1286
MPLQGRDELLDSLTHRLRSFVEDGDDTGILAPESVAEAQLLWQLSMEQARTIGQEERLAVVRLVAELLWRRGRLLNDSAEIQQGLELFVFLYRRRRDRVPPDVRTIIVHGVEATASWYLDIASDLVDQPGAAALAETEELLGKALAAAGEDAELRGRALTLLAIALRLRFHGSGDRLLLDEAIDAARAATAAFPDSSSNRVLVEGNLTGLLNDRFHSSKDPSDLDEAIAVSRRAAAGPETDPKTRAGVLANSAASLHTRYRHRRDAVDLAEAIELGRSAVEVAPDHPEVGGHLSNLGAMLYDRWKLAGNRDDLDEAIDVHRAAVEATPDHHVEWFKYRALAAEALMTRAWRSASLTDLKAGLGYATSAADRIPPNHPDHRAVLGTRAAVLAAAEQLGRVFGAQAASPTVALAERALEWGLKSPDAAALATAVLLLREVLDALPEGHPVTPRHQESLALALISQSRRTGSGESLGEAIACARSSLRETPRDHRNRGSRLNILASGLLRRYETLGDTAALEEAVTTARRALAEEADPERRPMLLSNLGLMLGKLFDVHGHEADLQEAIRSGRLAVAATTPDDPGKATRLGNLAHSLLLRYGRAATGHTTATLDDLSEAISVGEAAVAALTDHEPFRGQILDLLGSALRMRFERAGRADDLDASIDRHRAALSATLPGHPGHSWRARNLALSLGRRFELTTDPADIAAAVEHGCVAVERSDREDDRAAALDLLSRLLGAEHRHGADDEDVPAARSGLTLRAAHLLVKHGHSGFSTELSLTDVAVAAAMALFEEHEMSGRTEVLNEAVDLLRGALRAAPADDPGLAECRSMLCAVLLTRFETTGDTAELDEAVGLVAAEDTDSRRLNRRAIALARRYHARGNPADLDEAIDTLRAAHSRRPEDSRDPSTLLTHLGSFLRERYEAQGSEADLAEAVIHCRAAVAREPDSPVMLSNLAGALRRQAELNGDGLLLGEAVALLTSAVDLMDRPSVRRNLGNALLVRHARTRVPADLAHAIDHFRTAAGQPIGSPTTRLYAARDWGNAAAGAGRMESAAQGYETAVRLLPTAVWRGMSRAAQEKILADLGWLAADAAAVQVWAQHPETAVELLEHGRAVLWSQAVQSRSSLAELREVAPELAARLNEIRYALETDGFLD